VKLLPGHLSKFLVGGRNCCGEHSGRWARVAVLGLEVGFLTVPLFILYFSPLISSICLNFKLTTGHDLSFHVFRKPSSLFLTGLCS
jgi:hypothetical protein